MFLSYIKIFKFFKYNPHTIELVRKNKNNLTASFKLLIEKLWPNENKQLSQKKYYPPEEFKKKISDMNPLFKGIAANDAKDLVNFIIMTLHEELNKVKNKDINVNDELFDQRNKQEIFDYFIKNFALKNQSVIRDLFYSTNCTITQCLNCNNQLYNYQIYFFIVFPLEEVRKFKSQFINNQFNMNINLS